MADVLDLTSWTPRPWDSEFFGVSIGQITTNRSTIEDLERAVRQAQEASVDCLYFLADADDPATLSAAEANGFSLVDIRLTLECDTGQAERPMPPHERSAIRTSSLDDVPDLMALARVNHRNTRFHRDTHFDPARSDELYAVWIERSVKGELADIVWVVDVEGVPRGYLTLQAGSHADVIGLVAVDSEYRGMGYGRQLLATALTWTAGRGVPRVLVVTQGGSASAVRFYQQAGFRESAHAFWYHRWLTTNHGRS